MSSVAFALTVCIVLLGSIACGGAASPAPTAPADEPITGRGSAGGSAREQQPGASDGLIDTRGLATVVFVDADG